MIFITNVHQAYYETQKLIDQNNPFFMEVRKEEVHKALYIPYGFMFDGTVQQMYQMVQSWSVRINDAGV